MKLKVFLEGFNRENFDYENPDFNNTGSWPAAIRLTALLIVTMAIVFGL